VRKRVAGSNQQIALRQSLHRDQRGVERRERSIAAEQRLTRWEHGVEPVLDAHPLGDALPAEDRPEIRVWKNGGDLGADALGTPVDLGEIVSDDDAGAIEGISSRSSTRRSRLRAAVRSQRLHMGVRVDG
jgi:hypothetical protein